MIAVTALETPLNRAPALIAAILALTGPAAAEPLIGVVAPLSGPSEILGRQVAGGAFAASRSVGATLMTADDQCSADGGRAAAAKMVAAKAAAVIGFLCTDSLEAALPALKTANIPVVTVGVRTDGLTDSHIKTQWPLLRLAPRADAEAAAVAALLPPLWRDEDFAIVDDGTIGGREVAEAMRTAAETLGLKPVFVDTYRPEMDNQVALVGRLRRAGATHVFVGGDRRDIAIIARDAKARGLKLTLAGGESLRMEDSDAPLPPGTLMVGLPEWPALVAPAVLDALRAASISPEGYAIPAYTAVQIATQAGGYGGKGVVPYIGRDFTTALGAIRFDAKGDLTASPYRLYRFDGAQFVQADAD